MFAHLFVRCTQRLWYRSTPLPRILHQRSALVRFSSSQPPILFIIAMAYENHAFVWIALTKSNSALTKDIQNWFNTFSLPRHGTNLGSLRPSSSCLFILHYFLFLPFIWPPITSAGSRCHNIKYGHDLNTQSAETHVTKLRTRLTTTRGANHITAEETHRPQSIS